MADERSYEAVAALAVRLILSPEMMCGVAINFGCIFCLSNIFAKCGVIKWLLCGHFV